MSLRVYLKRESIQISCSLNFIPFQIQLNTCFFAQRHLTDIKHLYTVCISDSIKCYFYNFFKKNLYKVDNKSLKNFVESIIAEEWTQICHQLWITLDYTRRYINICIERAMKNGTIIHIRLFICLFSSSKFIYPTFEIH